MKKILKGIVNRMKDIANRMKGAAGHVWATVFQAKFNAQFKLAEENGQFVVDHAVVFVLIIVLGGIALGLLTAFLNTDLAPALKGKILGFLN